MDTVKNFLGTGWGFPPCFSKNEKGVRMVSDEEDIRESIEIILSTRIGERMMQPAFGCNLDDMVFEKINSSFMAYMKEQVSNAIYLYEPRVKPEDVVFSNQGLDGLILVDVTYLIKATNTRHNLVYPFYLEEGTLL